MFSAKTSWDVAENALASALRHRRQTGQPVFDLTASNPTDCGFAYPDAQILAALSSPKALHYEPIPFGLPHARQAVAGYYRESHGCFLAPEQIALTTSTSEAYSFLFHVLCDPGDGILVAQPSYPLVDFLAALGDVVLRPFSLIYEDGWHLDRSAIEAATRPRTRAITLVHPNNPTGHFTNQADREWLEDFCARRKLVLIVDEVFLDYPWKSSASSFLKGGPKSLTFVVSGLSKVSALPQMKLAWIAAAGPETLVKDALGRLEVVADTYLSLSAPLQHALPGLLEMRHEMQSQIRARVGANLLELDRLIDSCSLITRLEADGGWYAVLRLPALEAGEWTSLHLLSEQGLLLHPGSFYGFRQEGYWVVSLLTPAAEFSEGLKRLIEATIKLGALLEPRE